MKKSKRNENNKKTKIIRYLVITFILLSILYFGCLLLFWNANKTISKSLEEVCYLGQIISGVFVVGSTVVAVIQYVFNSKASQIEADKQRQYEAAKMSNEFREKVIPLIDILVVAYRQKELKEEIIDYLDNQELVSFDKKEIDKLFPNDKYKEYKVLLAENYASETDEEYRELKKKVNNPAISAKDKAILNTQIAEKRTKHYKFVSGKATELANLLEYMCICFNTNIADDKTVYQSLHKVFFLGVHMIYIFTFDSNVNEYDRVFYNIMTLYKKWRKINQEKKQEEDKLNKKMEEEVNSVKDKYTNKIPVSTRCE